MVSHSAIAGLPAAARTAASTAALRLSKPASFAEDLPELRRWRDLELIVTAILRALVGPPALEHGRVPETVALEMVVFDLAHALHAQGLPGEVLALAPAALSSGHARRSPALRRGPFAPGMRLERALAQ